MISEKGRLSVFDAVAGTFGYGVVEETVEYGGGDSAIPVLRLRVNPADR